jgi:spore maturation protein CgeB
MNIVLFYHSLLSDWNHGNAHFLRGIATELVERGNEVRIYEPKNNWSITNLVNDYGEGAINEFHDYYPLINSIAYDSSSIDLDAVLVNADLVIVHEWNEHELVKAIGNKKKKHGFKLLFHDTHHRAATERKSMEAYDLSNYDGVLAYGQVISNIYLQEGWTERAWTWHEAADTNIFRPLPRTEYDGDFVWIGNWGDEERTKELFEFIIEPVKELKLTATIYGVRYPEHAKKALKDAGITYGGWLPNYKAPEVFSKYRFTAHVPRRPYVMSLPGIPTIRPFEALACGIPMISAPWNDAEHLFTPGEDFLTASNKQEMIAQIQRLLTDDELVNRVTSHGLATIQSRHTCAHRVDQLYAVCKELGVNNIQSYSIA